MLDDDSVWEVKYQSRTRGGINLNLNFVDILLDICFSLFGNATTTQNRSFDFSRPLLNMSTPLELVRLPKAVRIPKRLVLPGPHSTVLSRTRMAR